MTGAICLSAAAMSETEILPRLRHDVALAVHEDRDPDWIYDAIIDPEPISSDAKAALWLYAMVMQDPDRSRRYASETLDQLHEHGLVLPPGD